MSSRIALFVLAAGATVTLLHALLRPRAFRLVVGCATAGACGVLAVSQLNALREHSVAAHTAAPVAAQSRLPVNFAEHAPVLYRDMTQTYRECGELAPGEEALTVQPNVFAQIGVLDVDGVRSMWAHAVLPALRRAALQRQQRGAFGSNRDALTDGELERRAVFCDLGSGVGNVCLQVLAETACSRVVGVEVIPSRVCAAAAALRRAVQYYPEVYGGKEATWLQRDLTTCAEALAQHGVTVLFTHSWMFDDALMHRVSELVASVPTLQCVVTSRKLDDAVLAHTSLRLAAHTHFSADWDDHAPFYIYHV